MKKLLSFVALMMLSIVCASAQDKEVYTVVGGFNDEAGDVENVLFGKTWEPTFEANDMVLGADGLYTLTKQGVELPACTIYYKVVKNHSWDTSWGFTGNKDGNADYVVSEAGTYDVTFTFNPNEVLGNGFNVTCNLSKSVTFDFTTSALHPAGASAADVNGNIFNDTFTVDGFSLQVVASTSPARVCYYNNRDTCLVNYKGGILEFKAPQGRAITSIAFTTAGSGTPKFIASPESASTTAVWAGNASAVRLVADNTSYISNFVLTVADATSETNAPAAIEYVECANIAAFNALPAGTFAKVALNDAEVTGVSADGWSSAWIQDATGGAMIQYSSLIGPLHEDLLVNGAILAVRNEASGKSKMNEAPATPQSEYRYERIPEYTMIQGTIGEVNIAENLNRVVKIVGANFEATSATAGKLSLNGDTINVNNGSETANEQLHKISFQSGDKMEDVVMVAILNPASATRNQLLPISMMLLGETEAEETLTVERYPGLGYGTTDATVDFTAAQDFLGVEEVTADMLCIVNPDGTEIKNYGTYDGWFNTKGFAETWGDLNGEAEAADKAGINVKFWQAIPEGTFTICDMNGADEIGKTYTVKWALKANAKTYTYNVNVTFVEVPEVGELTKSDLTVSTSVVYTTDEGEYVTKWASLTDEQVAKICEELGIETLSEATPYGYNPTTGELLNEPSYAGFDGWRDANGDFHNWTGNAEAPFCIKFNDGQNYECYNIGGMEPQTFKGYWAIANDTKYVLVEIEFIYNAPAPIELELTGTEIEVSVTYDVSEFDYSEKTISIYDQLPTILEAIELDSLTADACVAYIYNPQDGSFAKEGFNGWRGADGLGHVWTGNAEAPFCVQFRYSEDLYCYNLFGIEPQTFTTYYAIANDSTKKAAIIKVNFTYEGEFPAYTVAGCFKAAAEDAAEEASFFGTAWATDVEANDMTKTDRTLWTLKFNNVKLDAGTIYYKVVADHSWDQTWGFTASETNPTGNADYVVNEAGRYDITFYFSPMGLDNNFNVSCDLVKLEAIKGDVNEDGQVGIGDIVAITNVMAGIETNADTIALADVNGDGQVGIGDIVAITNIMAGIVK